MNLFIALVYLFTLNRFGGIEIKADKGEVRFFQGNKVKVEEITFESKLRTVSPGVYLTPEGVSFHIVKLPKPVIHDRNRRINSGDYKLRITGTGRAFDAIVARLPVLANFAASGEKMTFYGDAY
jgi:hypothetical protein